MDFRYGKEYASFKNILEGCSQQFLKIKYIFLYLLQEFLRSNDAFLLDVFFSFTPSMCIEKACLCFHRNLQFSCPVSGNGVQLEYSRNVEYLGVILDQKLNRNEQTDKINHHGVLVMLETFWENLGTAAKDDVLATSSCYKIHEHLGLVWWSKFKEVTVLVKLHKMQRMACLGITDAMRICPNATLEIILGIVPPHLQVNRLLVLID